MTSVNFDNKHWYENPAWFRSGAKRDTDCWIAQAANQLAQYAAYSEEMRHLGRGFTPSGPHSTQDVINALRDTLHANQIADDWQAGKP